MELFRDDRGLLTKARIRIGSNKEVCLTKWNDTVFLHLNDSSKCFGTGVFDKTKSKNVSLRWDVARRLRDVIGEMEIHAEQMIHNNQVRTLIFCFLLHFSIHIAVVVCALYRYPKEVQCYKKLNRKFVIYRDFNLSKQIN